MTSRPFLHIFTFGHCTQTLLHILHSAYSQHVILLIEMSLQPLP